MSRGGHREGAGRKPINPNDKKVQVSVSVSPDTKSSMVELREAGIDINKEFEKLISKLWWAKFLEENK